MVDGLVTVVVPNLNYGSTLNKCIDSILQQTYKNIEILVVDGGSNDSSIKIIENYESKISKLKFVSREDSGQSNAINKGIEISKGEFITWLNSDDYLTPNAIELCVSALLKNPNCGLAYGSVINIGEDGRILQLNLGLSHNKDEIHFHDFIPQAGAVFRSSLNMRLDEDLHWGMDWDLWIKIAKVSDLINVNNVLGYCLIEGDKNRKSSQNCPQRTRELLLVKEKNGNVNKLDIFFSKLIINLGYKAEKIFGKKIQTYKYIIKVNAKIYRFISKKEIML
jgi:glycosyltransferase involved in cell wall biosynthesis